MDATRVKMLVPRQSAGSHRDGGSNSVSGIISTLVPILLISCAGFLAFALLRTKLQRVYEPRSIVNLVPQHHEAKRGEKSLFGWLPAMTKVNNTDILKQHSLDAFLWLRFLKMLVIISIVGCCITWPILFPVNATGGGGQQQLNILSFSNVANPNRYYAHALIAWIFGGFVVYLVTRERKFFIGLRQAYFLSPLNAVRLSSRTVLFQTLPDDCCDMDKLRVKFSHARKIWMVPDCEELQELVDDRNKEWQRVEKAEVTLIQAVWKKASKGDVNRENPLEGVEMPKHRTKFLIGKKVDTITHSRSAMTKQSQEIEKTQTHLIDGNGKMMKAAFVEFENQIAAQSALQFACKESKMQWKPRHIGIQPDEIIWKNLGTSYKVRKIKMLVAATLIGLMCIFWTVPVAFVGILTNVNYLTTEVPFLGFINDIPPVILGVVTGLLPTILLSVLMALVPIFCRFLAKFAGAATLTEVEMKTQAWYFAFQVIQVFLVTTFTSGASAVAAQIVQQPASAVTLLAQNLPKASNFYISYFILQGLMMAMLQLLNIVPFLLFYVLGMLDKTPRKKYNRWTSLQGLGWGSTYPKFTNLGVIALSYSCIAPLILGFATIGFALLYAGFKYNFLFVYGLKVDMKGEAYPRALQQLLTGVYLSTLCLIGLFAIATANSPDAIGPLVLMIIFLIVVGVYQFLLDRALTPLEQGIPIYRLEANPHSVQQAREVEEAKEKADNETEKSSGAERASDSIDGSKKINEKSQLSSKKPDGVVYDGKTGNFLTRWANPYIDSTFEENKQLLDAWSNNFNGPEQYTAEDIDVAYQHPALSAETKPVVWIPRDDLGVSQTLVQDNRGAGLESTDEHAWLNKKGKVEWDYENLAQLPIYEEPKLW